MARRWPFLHSMAEAALLYPPMPHLRGAKRKLESEPWLVAGFFSASHGQGAGARLDVDMLRRAGHRVYALDISSAFNLADLSPDTALCGRDEAPRTGPLLLHCNAPETGRALRYLGPELTAGRKIIGYWAWELETPPRHWRKAYGYLDELWVVSSYTARAFADAPFPVRVMPHAVAPLPDGRMTREQLGIPKRFAHAHLFLCMADCRSDLIRKNIMGAVTAFSRAAGGAPEAALLINLHHTEFGGPEYGRIVRACRKHDNIFLFNRLLGMRARNSLLHRSDTILSLHRAEGYGLVLAEALQLGKNVIATAYSGNMDFTTPKNSLLVPYTLVPVRGATESYRGYEKKAVWAEPDTDTATRFIQQCIDRPKSA